MTRPGRRPSGPPYLHSVYNWFVLTDIFLANGDEPNLILPKFGCPLYFFVPSVLLDKNSQWFCILVCDFFTSKHYRSRWENLDRGQYPFQPIRFTNLVVLSPCETESYNKHWLKLSNYRWYGYKILNDTKGNNLYLTWLVEKMMLVLKRIPKN